MTSSPHSPIGDITSQMTFLSPISSPNVTPPMVLHQSQVKGELDGLKPGKAVGPDDIGPRLLRTCSTQLSGIFTYLFNLSLDLQKVPKLWKTSCLIPIPKKRYPSNHNDYRPVALTSHILKTFERQVFFYIKASMTNYVDPLQFAYQSNMGVDDALIYMLQRTYAHLDTPDASVRFTFFDFSSAFNTIQPQLLCVRR